MIDENSVFGGFLTDIGEAKQANANALEIPWKLTHMLLGDANGNDPVPAHDQTQLINQVHRAAINQLSVDPANPAILIAEIVLPPNVGGWWIRELGLEDEDGDFVAVANCPPSYKPLLAQGSGRNQVVRMHLILSNTANVQLKIDPSVVLATRKYVDDQRADHEASRNHPDATTTAKGFTQHATADEARAGSRTDRAATPFGIHAAFQQFGLGSGASTPTRLNDLTNSGLYYSTASTGVSDRPASADIYGYVLVIRHGSNSAYAVQYFVPHNADRFFIRRRDGVSGWSGWVETYHTGNLPSSTEPGTVVVSAVAQPQDGYLRCNGAEISRTSYAALFDAIGTTFGAGDGSTTFNIPDLRGEFIRGWNPSSTSGPDRDRSFGDNQLDAFQGHVHVMSANSHPRGTDDADGNGSGGADTRSRYSTSVMTYAEDQFGNGEPRVADETRPRNVALSMFIKY